jgi:hypothetical protein
VNLTELGPSIVIYDEKLEKGVRIDLVNRGKNPLTGKTRISMVVDPLGSGDV